MQNEFKKLYKLAEETASYFDDKLMVTASVLLQNIAFYSDDYFLNREKIDKAVALLKSMSEYRSDQHVLSWIASEAEMNIQGYLMSLEVEENEYDINFMDDLNDLDND